MKREEESIQTLRAYCLIKITHLQKIKIAYSTIQIDPLLLRLANYEGCNVLILNNQINSLRDNWCFKSQLIGVQFVFTFL